MLTTGCEGCCFLKTVDDQKGCSAGQVCGILNNQVVATGYCRICRSNDWAKKQGTQDNAELMKKVVAERALKFDLLVIFDEKVNTLQHLQRTLDSDWYKKYVNKIIIVDTTGNGERKNIALQYLKNHDKTISLVVDSSTQHEEAIDVEKTIRRISKQVDSNFFMVMYAGRILSGNVHCLGQIIQEIPSRVIHWHFPHCIGQTVIVPHMFNYGLFITKPYSALMKNHKVRSFSEQIRKEEQETEMGLSWFCPDIWMV